MNVFIKTEGGKNIGFGHLTRCISIYEAFLERGIKPFFIINNSFKPKGFLNKNKIKFLVNDRLKITSCDILIIDSYLLLKDSYDEAYKNAKLLVSIDDFNRLEYPGGLVVNGSIYAQRLKYRRKKNLKYLLGIDYIPLRENFWKSNSKKINKEVKNILLTFGGFNDSFTKEIAKFLIRNFNYNLYVILNNKDEFIENNKVHPFHCVSERKMKALMLKSDICISGGGQTTYELARCGVPTIGICFAENQLLNLRGWKKAGFLEFAGWYNDKNLFKSIDDILRKLDYKKRIKMSRIGQRLVDGQGAKRIAEEIMMRIEYKQYQ